ncbi:MAG TPA: methyltransferase domain-containing protein [Chitinispirillaceae bacterium]|nr:methyltransferase domain-containing protein [Chitinispirillaceae bacterium]
MSKPDNNDHSIREKITEDLVQSSKSDNPERKGHSEPDQEVWNRFWRNKKDIDKVYPSSPSVLKAITRQLNVQGMRILEVGAGSGRDSIELTHLGAHVTVLDFAWESLRIISNLKNDYNIGDDKLNLIRADAFHTPYHDGTFDLVFHQGLAEHFRDPLPLLKENYRITKPGGYCLCDVPQTFHLYTVIKKMLIAMDKWFAGWETQMTMPQLKKLMSISGFEVCYCYGDWMRPNLIWRMLREAGLKYGIELPKYPFQDSCYAKLKDKLLDSLADNPLANWTQLSIGVMGRKPE